MPTLDVLSSPTPYRALIVDDEPTVQQLLVRLLDAAGWLVEVAATWAGAKAVIEDRTQPLDLLLLDQQLPDGLGIDLVPLAQARRNCPDIVIVTAYQDDKLLLRALRLGVLDFLHKPFGLADIGNMLRARTIRERQKLGIVADEFERVDKDFQDVRSDLSEIKSALSRIEEWVGQRQKTIAAGQGGSS